jgi:probable HAF family extracellular repeat protein
MLHHRSRRGQGTTEYALLLAIVCGVLILALPAFGLGLGYLNSTVNSTVNSAIGGGGGGGGGVPTPTPAPTPGPPVVAPPSQPGDPITISCYGFNPAQQVQITFTDVVSADTLVLDTTTADADGNVINFVIHLPSDALGDYTFACNGVQGPPVTIGPPTGDPILPPPIIAGPSEPTMEVTVNSCSAAYVRTQPTVHSAAATLLPAGTGPLTVYAASLTGGSWGAPPNTVWYTCDGQGDTWYQIVSGTYAGDYIFTGGVHETSVVRTTLPLLPGCVAGQATGIDGNTVVGYDTTAAYAAHGFAYDLVTHVLTDLGSGTYAYSISGSLIVGSSGINPFVYDLSTGIKTDLPLLAGYASGGASAIDGNVVVGSDYTSGYVSRGFAYNLNTQALTDLGVLPGRTASVATAVSGDTVVGYSNANTGGQIAFSYDLGTDTMTDLGLLPGGSWSGAQGINGHTIVGYADNSAGSYQAFAYDLDTSTMTDLGNLPGLRHGNAVAIDGSIVTGNSFSGAGLIHAFAYNLNSSTMTDLGMASGNTWGVAVSGNLVVGYSSDPNWSNAQPALWNMSALHP